MKKRTSPTRSELLEGLSESLGRCFNEDSARQIASLRASPSANRRISRLARKCDEGRLTSEERAEYLYYVKVGDFIALLQAKARRFLASKTHA